MTRAAEVARQHLPAVLANQLALDERWGQPCSAYNVCTRPDPGAVAAFGAVQDRIARLEPALSRVPPHALHANVAWLLPVHEEFDSPKDDIWLRRGPEWLDVLADTLAITRGFRLRYRDLIATNSAIIAVADAPNELAAIRGALLAAIDLPGGTSRGDLVHTTLFRYAEPLRDPAALVRLLDGGDCHVTVDVTEIIVLREKVFPSLDYDVVHRKALA